MAKIILSAIFLSLPVFASESSLVNARHADVLEASALGNVSEVTFMYMGQEERTVIVSPLTAIVISGAFSTLKPYIETIDKRFFSKRLKAEKETRFAAGKILCDHIARGILIAQRLDIVDEIMNGLPDTNEKKLAFEANYPEFLSYFVRILWIQLLRDGNDDLLNKMHEANLLPFDLLPVVITEIAYERDANILMQRVAKRYGDREQGRGNQDGNRTHVESMCRGEPLAVMLKNGVSDACILQCMKASKPQVMTRLDAQEVPTALLMLSAKRYNLFASLLAFGGDWLGDRDLIVDFLLEQRLFELLDDLLKSPTFYQTKQKRGLLLDRVSVALRTRKVSLGDMESMLKARFKPLIQELMLRVIESGDEDAIVFLFESNHVDLNAPLISRAPAQAKGLDAELQQWFSLIQEGDLSQLDKLHSEKRFDSKKFPLLVDRAIKALFESETTALSTIRTLIAFYNNFSAQDLPFLNSDFVQTKHFARQDMFRLFGARAKLIVSRDERQRLKDVLTLMMKDITAQHELGYEAARSMPQPGTLLAALILKASISNDVVELAVRRARKAPTCFVDGQRVSVSQLLAQFGRLEVLDKVFGENYAQHRFVNLAKSADPQDQEEMTFWIKSGLVQLF